MGWRMHRQVNRLQEYIIWTGALHLALGIVIGWNWPCKVYYSANWNVQMDWQVVGKQVGRQVGWLVRNANNKIRAFGSNWDILSDEGWCEDSMKDDFQLKTTFDGDDLSWRTTFDRNTLWCCYTPVLAHGVINQSLSSIWVQQASRKRGGEMQIVSFYSFSISRASL